MTADFCVIGGGIAGLSIAYELRAKAKVVVLEKETDLSYHSTGRSAALYSEFIATPLALALSRLSRPFLTSPPPVFSMAPLHRDIGCVFTATRQQATLVQQKMAQHAALQLLDQEQLSALIPILRLGEESITSGLYEKKAFRIDVAALVNAYRSQFIAGGGEIRCKAEVVALTHDTGGWKIQLSNNEVIHSRKIVNAAGAWGDKVAEMAGIVPLGLQPMRRTIITFDGPDYADTRHWPAVGGIDGGYYILPEAGLLAGSAADEVASPAYDAQPEEYDIALAAHNIESNTTLNIKRIQHKWAGLRTFAPDRKLVAGYDSQNHNFFWFVGQGGFGIQTAVAAAQAAATLALEDVLPAHFQEAGVTANALSPQRLVQSTGHAKK